jgi:hypothetical protein
MSGKQRWVAIFLAVALCALGAMATPRSATALHGCFNYQNSTPVAIPDEDDSLSTYYCAGTATTVCTECFDISNGGNSYSDCVTDGGGDEYCEYYD